MHRLLTVDSALSARQVTSADLAAPEDLPKAWVPSCGPYLWAARIVMRAWITNRYLSCISEPHLNTSIAHKLRQDRR